MGEGEGERGDEEEEERGGEGRGEEEEEKMGEGKKTGESGERRVNPKYFLQTHTQKAFTTQWSNIEVLAFFSDRNSSMGKIRWRSR